MDRACPSCGAPFDPMQGRYAPSGVVVCAPCGERLIQAAQATERKSAGSSFVGAFGALLVALLSFVVEHRVISFLFPAIAIVGGAGTALTALRNPDAIAALGWKRYPTVGLGALAVLLALLSLLVDLLA